MLAGPRHFVRRALDRISGVRGIGVDTPTLQAAHRPPEEEDFSLEVPFGNAALAGAVSPPGSVAAIIHVFYPEMCEEIVAHLHHIPFTFDCYISTDTAEKKASILSSFANLRKGSVEVRVLPNRGRDIAPKLIGMKDVYAKYDFFLHLHTKLSPSGGAAFHDWRSYLYRSLLGSPDIVRSIFLLFETTDVGLVFPQHFYALRDRIDWGHEFNRVKRLVKGAGVSLRADLPLEFPSGSMFWARSSAIAPLLALNLSLDDFAPEADQLGNTIAHAIERSYLYFTEAAGHRWAKVAVKGDYPLGDTLVPVTTLSDIAPSVGRVHRPLVPR